MRLVDVLGVGMPVVLGSGVAVAAAARAASWRELSLRAGGSGSGGGGGGGADRAVGESSVVAMARVQQWRHSITPR